MVDLFMIMKLIVNMIEMVMIMLIVNVIDMDMIIGLIINTVENEFDHTDSQYARYGCDHQADYQYRGIEHNHRADNHYGGCGSGRANNERYGVNRWIDSNQRHHFCGDGSYIYGKFFWGNHQNNNYTQQPKQNHWMGWHECL